MIDYSRFDELCAYLKSQGGIAHLDTMGYPTSQKDIYRDVFKKLDAYLEFEKDPNFLLDFKIVLIPMGIDEILLFNHKDSIQKFLDQGGILLSFTQNFLQWLPGNSLYKSSQVPIKIREVKTCGHFITYGVLDYDINYRRGVKGFFNRGYFTPPLDACVFLKDSEDQCVGYIDSTTTKGIIISTAGADLVGYGLYESSTAKRMGVNLLFYLEKILKQKDVS